METFNIGTKDDGSPLVHYHAPGEHVVLTGPASGVVTLPDGTEIDVSAPCIVVESVEQAAEVVAVLDAQNAEVVENG